jgi:hypothetical protein
MNIHHSLKYHTCFFVVIIFLMFIKGIPLCGQNIILNVPEWKDYYRREQLLGKVELNRSFLSLPFHLNDTIKKGLKWELMPIVFQQQYTTVHPDSKNDGLMIPATGYQVYASAGIALRHRYFSFQMMPEMVSAENKLHQGYEGAPKFKPSNFFAFSIKLSNTTLACSVNNFLCSATSSVEPLNPAIFVLTKELIKFCSKFNKSCWVLTYSS